VRLGEKLRGRASKEVAVTKKKNVRVNERSKRISKKANPVVRDGTTDRTVLKGDKTGHPTFVNHK